MFLFPTSYYKLSPRQRKQKSTPSQLWIPACAGMTKSLARVTGSLSPLPNYKTVTIPGLTLNPAVVCHSEEFRRSQETKNLSVLPLTKRPFALLRVTAVEINKLIPRNHSGLDPESRSLRGILVPVSGTGQASREWQRDFLKVLPVQVQLVHIGLKTQFFPERIADGISGRDRNFHLLYAL